MGKKNKTELNSWLAKVDHYEVDDDPDHRTIDRLLPSDSRARAMLNAKTQEQTAARKEFLTYLHQEILMGEDNMASSPNQKIKMRNLLDKPVLKNGKQRKNPDGTPMTGLDLYKAAIKEERDRQALEKLFLLLLRTITKALNGQKKWCYGWAGLLLLVRVLALVPLYYRSKVACLRIHPHHSLR